MSKDSIHPAIHLLEKTISVMKARAEERGEKYQDVMGITVTKFHETSGKLLSIQEGYQFMQCLKEARAGIRLVEDDLVDLLAYKALELVHREIHEQD